jgi:putative DNA primase/helicase
MGVMNATNIAKALQKSKQNSSGWMACCPAHDDHNPSLSISDGEDGKVLVKCFAGCNQLSVIDALKSKGLWPEPIKKKLHGKQANSKRTPKDKTTATYDYCDSNSNLAYQVVRKEPKSFLQRRPDDNGGWIWNLQGVTQVPYRLSDFIKKSYVLIVEGEKDVDRLWDLGIPATTNAGGANKWPSELNQYLKDKNVFIIPDNDDAGRKQAELVASNLIDIAASVKVCKVCEDMPEKADISDWLDDDNDPSTLLESLESFPEWEPETAEVTNKVQLSTDFSEDSLALLFIARHGNVFRWTAGRDWLHYDGAVWQRDQIKSYYSYIQKLCREQITLKEGRTSTTRVRSAKTRNGVAELAKHDPRIAMLDDVFRPDPNLLNTPNGIVDLRTGIMRTSSPEDYCTQITSVSPSNEPPKLFLKTLNEIFLSDEEVIAFVQRLLGYTATGLTTEQVIVFFYGSGANGKSLLLDLVARILGTYAIKLPINVLMQSKHQRHETEIAQLDGVRLAISSEPEQGAAWAEAKIKELTGDRTIRGRFMRKDFYEFLATHKHLVAGNFKPRLTGGDPAIARRVKLVPFLANFEGEKCDPDLPEKLFAEASQILGWLINGAKQWHENGLQVPEAIGNASHEYMAEMDDLGVWMKDRCNVSPEYTEKSSDLYADFKAWKDFRREPVLSQTVFGKQLSAKGFSKVKSNGIMKYQGIELSPTRENYGQSRYQGG